MKMKGFQLCWTLRLLFAFGVVMLAIFGLQPHAFASESMPCINWDTPNPDSLIPSTSSEAQEAVAEEGSLSEEATVTRITMYRLYNKYTGEHFYTASESEKTKLKKAGWNDEGLGWYAPSKSDTPVYRLYNPYVPGGDHHYTNSIMEYNNLKREGWRQEGIGWYSVNENESDKVPLYRVYNPFAVTGTHHYTLDSKEKSNLVKLKWRDEGVGWYGYATQKIDFTKAKVDTTAKTYNGTQFKPSATVTGLKAGTDYTVTYGTNKNAGTGTITIKGKGNYSGSKTYTFVINRVNVSNATVTLGNSLTYNTKEQVQTLKSVKVGKLTLKTSDYTVSDNKQIKAGSYKLKITGTGNFTGTKTCDFKIVRLNIKGAQVSLGRSLVYNGKPQTKTVSEVTVNGTTLTSEDYSVIENEQTKAGNYTLKVQGTGNCEGEITRDFSIEKKMLSVSGIKAENKEYNGNTDASLDLRQASLSNWFKDDDVSLKSATGKFVSKDVATGVKVTLDKIELGGEDADNYYILLTGVGDLKADITQKQLTVTGVTASDKSYDGKTTAEIVTKSATVDGFLDGEEAELQATGDFADANAGDDKNVTATLTLSGDDAGNYSIKDATRTLQADILSVVKFDTNCSTNIGDESVHLGGLVKTDVTSMLPTRKGLDKEGWYDNGACSGTKWDFATSTVNANEMTLYANWTPMTGDANGNLSYWIAPAYNFISEGTNEAQRTVSNEASADSKDRDNYVSEEWNVLKSSTELQEDLLAMKNGDEDVKSEYEDIMTSDKYHLYTKWNGTTTDGSGAEQAKNAYVEFRIVEVGAHDEGNDTTSPNTLTFEATHTLPTAYNFHAGDYSRGWGTSYLYSRLQENGEIYELFNDGLTNCIATVKKRGVAGRASGALVDWASKMWVASFRELSGGYYAEGTEYQFYIDHLTVEGSDNPCLKRTTRAGNEASGNYRGNFYWSRTSKVGTSMYSQLAVNGNGNTGLGAFYGPKRALGVVPCFTFAEPSVTFNTQGHGNDTYVQMIDENGKVSSSSDDYGTSTGLTLEGWYDNSACKGTKVLDADGSGEIAAGTTLYANWIPTQDSEDGDLSYWISPSYKYVSSDSATGESQANSDYVKEEWNVLKSSAEIKADIETMKAEAEAGTAGNDGTVTSKYKSIMNSDKYHLYTKYSGGESETAYDNSTSTLNGYAEFRIIEVGEHLNDSADTESGDDSTLTFMATHLLPTAYQMNSSGPTNEGGWNASELQKKMNSEGDDGVIYKKFSSTLVKDVKKVSKVYGTGGSTTSTDSGNYKFWLLSASELGGSGAPISEGNEYTWCTNKGITWDSANTVLAKWKTRAGSTPGSANTSDERWWQRSPCAGDSKYFLVATPSGYININSEASLAWGIAPAFCF